MIPQHGSLEISRSRLRHNLQLLQHRAGSAKLCPVIKANAYGHGLETLADLIEEQSITWVCVYSLQEAFELTRYYRFGVLVLAPLVMHAASPDLIHSILEKGAGMQVRLNITDLQSARLLSQSIVMSKRRISLPVHIQIDTGLTRIGVEPEHATELAETIASLPGLRLEGLFAHLSHGDTPDNPTLIEQLTIFQKIAAPLKQKYPHLLLHLQNSGGTINLPSEGLDLVRIGIALYGLQPSTTHPIPGLQPIARLTAPILAIHDRPANTGVGYGHTFVTSRPSRLAIVPVGYADGYPRQLSNTKNAVAQLHGQTVPVVGRVSMDQIILDITDVPAAAPGDIVTVISTNSADLNSLDQMADAIGTIGYELATHFGARLNRVIVD